MFNRRFFGKTQIDLSPITLGTMRFSADRFQSKKQSINLLNYLYDQGIDSYHTSHEYGTHDHFCDVFRQFKKKKQGINTSHIIKLSSPHFEELDFSCSGLERKIDDQLKALSVDQIDIVQWLFRQKNNIDEIRIPKLIASAQHISETFTKLVQSGKVRAFASFPYTVPFTEIVNRHNIVEGFVDYLNVGERCWANKLQQSDMDDCGFIAIRPLLAGKVLEWGAKEGNNFPAALQMEIKHHGLAHWAITYPLLNPKVTSVILSISNKYQAVVAANIVGNFLSDGNLTVFNDTTAALDKMTCIS